MPQICCFRTNSYAHAYPVTVPFMPTLAEPLMLCINLKALVGRRIHTHTRLYVCIMHLENWKFI